SACASGQSCVSGSCALVCPSGLSNCSGKCVDITNNTANCGACGSACASGQSCVSGSCTLVCPSGLSNCSGKCVDTTNNTANCGACGSACAVGQSCVSGSCTLVCPSGLSNCSGNCVDTSNNPAHCGACGTVCNAGKVCASGACINAGQCVPNAQELCYTGPANSMGIGVCKPGLKTCKSDGSGYGACVGQVLPGVETCTNSVDDDCDGELNESGTGCVCTPNAVTACYTGPNNTSGIGLCKPGTTTCNALGTAAGACEGQVVPSVEVCDNSKDEDCDGSADEGDAGCGCTPGATQPCYTGPSGSNNVGPCKGGTKICGADGKYGNCVGEVVPVTEDCTTAIDDDCDGSVNEVDAGCGCVAGSTLPCYTGATGTQNVGPCKAGSKTCNPEGSGYGNCVGQVIPITEICGNTVDEDCNGNVTDCNGNPIWFKQFGDSNVRVTTGIGIDPLPSNSNSERVVVTGYFKGTHNTSGGTFYSQGEEDIFVVRRTDTLGHNWSRHCHGDKTDISADVTAQINSVTVLVGRTNSTSLKCYNGPTVTGGGGYDAFVTTFHDNGNVWWTKRFGDAKDQRATAVATDAAKNIFVAGEFEGTIELGGDKLVSAGGADIWIAKFSENGTHLWSQRFGGAGNDQVGSVSLDVIGGAYLVGGFEQEVDFGGGKLTSKGLRDIYVLRLNGADGAHSVSKRFGDAKDQFAVDVAVDSIGNLRLTGEYEGTVNFGGSDLTSSGGKDIFLANINFLFQHIWSRSYGNVGHDHVSGVGFDDSGATILAGHFYEKLTIGSTTYTSSGDADLFAARISVAGTPEWVKTSGDEFYQAIKGVAVGTTTGNPYFAGEFFGKITLKGTIETRVNQDTFIVRLNWQDGTGQYITHNRTGHHQYARRLRFDGAGNLILGGEVNYSIDLGGGMLHTKVGGQTVSLSKYDVNGSHLWSQVATGSGTRVLGGIHTDAFNNIYTSGYFDNTINLGGNTLIRESSNDAFLAKYDKDGKHIWSRSIKGSGNEQITGLTSDPFGNVYITGRFSSQLNFGTTTLNSASGSWDAFLAKLDVNGDLIWAKSFGDNDSQYAWDVSIDLLGNVVIVGEHQACINFGGGNLCTSGSYWNIFVAKFDAAGTFKWGKQFGDTNGHQYGRSVSVSGTDVVIAGHHNGCSNFGGGNLCSNGTDGFVAKLNFGGAHVWSKLIGQSSTQYIDGVSVDNAGNVAVAGTTHASLTFGSTQITHKGGADAFHAKFDAAGNPLWAFSLASNGNEHGKAVATNALGDLFFAGQFDKHGLVYEGKTYYSYSNDMYLIKRSK
ncbi:MAG TPA: hypothetical protein EYN66_15380, partial [Myxococcales bacterium]|nr:hypothetical protein [Myxococcales bacterium]